MDAKTAELLAKHQEIQWTLSQGEVARRLGCSRQSAATFLEEHAVPFYRIGQKKLYLAWEVLEAVEKTRWKASG